MGILQRLRAINDFLTSEKAAVKYFIFIAKKEYEEQFKKPISELDNSSLQPQLDMPHLKDNCLGQLHYGGREFIFIDIDNP